MAGLVAYAALIATFFIVGRAVRNLFFHPLRKIPGPRLAAATSLWLFYKEMKAYSDEEVFNLHKRLGTNAFCRLATARC